jgi:phosphoribosylanthranilate isomerase
MGKTEEGMAKIKICGLRRPADIEYVNQAKPEYAGFVFAPSKRRVTVQDAAQLGKRLLPGIQKVGVFVNEKVENVVQTAQMCCLDIVQLHGDETPGDIAYIRKNTGLGIWKAVRVKDADSLSGLEIYAVDAYLLDTYIDGSFGGTGKAFDWKIAREVGRSGRIILAGGLHAENVKNAIAIARPYGVDVSSGVETDGCKDEVKIRDFVCRARSYE